MEAKKRLAGTITATYHGAAAAAAAREEWEKIHSARQIPDDIPEVILPPEARSEWLSEEPAEEATLKRMLASYPAERMTVWPVDGRVGSVKNNDPSLIEPISPIDR